MIDRIVRRRFGQNYLIDKSVIFQIVEKINPSKEDNFIEIGPGRGAITKNIQKNSKNLTLIEINKDNVDYLRAVLGNKVKIFEEDVLKVNLGFINNDDRESHEMNCLYKFILDEYQNLIPCELCDELINIEYYKNHVNQCMRTPQYIPLNIPLNAPIAGESDDNLVNMFRNIIDQNTIIIFDEFLINDTWEQDEAKALFDFCSK